MVRVIICESVWVFLLDKIGAILLCCLPCGFDEHVYYCTIVLWNISFHNYFLSSYCFNYFYCEYLVFVCAFSFWNSCWWCHFRFELMMCTLITCMHIHKHNCFQVFSLLLWVAQMLLICINIKQISLDCL